MPNFAHSMSGPFIAEDPYKEDKKDLKRKK